MNSFVATAAPAVAASPIDGTLTNDGFFPDIDLSALRDAMRLDGTVIDFAFLRGKQVVICWTTTSRSPTATRAPAADQGRKPPGRCTNG
ncbi:hypothetical protein Bcep1808_0187 [Burkholderia vietnamiensis G4]|uniref:Uncharacterized protein n=1 Tax=Burkholderia vietnamiensis (strain G4 / LMG 22486) TaxID=269482 RepID=A4JAA6_BURVG|nr:hypothetical protein Bcep1808_0187 [Burkholderia vietnamiensis G4]